MNGKLRGVPVCEPILIWRGPVSPKPVLLRPSTTRFVSESSHDGGSDTPEAVSRASPIPSL